MTYCYKTWTVWLNLMRFWIKVAKKENDRWLRRQPLRKSFRVLRNIKGTGKVAWKDIYLYCLQEHFVDVMRNQEFLILPPDDVAKLLSSDDLNVPNEETIFHALVTWAKNDSANRKQHLAKLLAHIKLPLMPPQVLCLVFHYWPIPPRSNEYVSEHTVSIESPVTQ